MRKRTTRVTIAISLLVAACGDDGNDAGRRVESNLENSATIITTTTADAATTPPDVSAGSSTIPASPSSLVDDADATTVPLPGPTIAPATAAPVTAPPSSEPTVGDPIVEAVEFGRFSAPVDLVVRPGDDAAYIVEQGGQIERVLDGRSITVADIADRIVSGGEQGLLGLEFSPDGTFAYVDYTDTDGNTNIAEYPVAADGTVDTTTERILLTVPQPYGNHNGGDLATGPDGMLYITLGDGGSANDPERNASDPAVLLGSLLRIDPTPSADSPYTIPADNPFANGPFEGITGAPEVWSWGLRNPWKIAFDPVSDQLWIADVGQNEYEEVDVVGPTADGAAGRGVDFGWSGFEGTVRFNDDVPDPGTSTPPVLTYRHGDDGCSISGGVPYRGTAIPGLAPAYVYSDYCSGVIWALDLVGGRNLVLLDGFSQVTAVRTGPDGEIYVLQGGGTISKLVPG